MDEEQRQVRRIFEEASERSGPDRAALLDRECRGRPERRAQVEALVRALEGASGFLTCPTGPGATVVDPPNPLRERPGTLIGRYKLLEQIGEGGFGVVFLAEQREPVTRKVALKIIRLGMDTKQVIARFEAERQALAMMDHPNIARVLDAGETETGRPYFVMELVRGDPITAYCDRNNLSTKDRLDLFTQVCHAVQHAHQKGVIHRDIKPGNVLITVADGKPIPKVIDFGIAKAAGGAASKLTAKTLFTEHRALIGTPAYMSPEQAEMSGVDIDTRSDIYSLGVLLYELLTGTTPFDTKSLMAAGLAEIQRIIREVEPEKPSTRVSSRFESGASATTRSSGAPGTSAAEPAAANRRGDPGALSRTLRGDLDWIVMKALEKDRSRRYETANGLAADVERHLAGEPVLAAPPSAAYRARKFVRRHRVGVAAGAGITIALVLGIIGTTAGFLNARAQRDRARMAEDLARSNEQRARDESARAEREREAAEAARSRAEIVATFMSDTLKGVGPNVALGRDTTMLREMMDGAAAQIERGELRAAPEAEVRLRLTIGATYRMITAYEPARRMLEPAMALARRLTPAGGDSTDLADALHQSAHLAESTGRPAEAEPLLEQALEMKRRLHEGDGREVAEVLGCLASVRKANGRASEAEPLCIEALAMYRRLFPGDHPDVATSLGRLGEVLVSLGRWAEAEVLYTQALDMYQRLFPGDHPHVAVGLNNLGEVLDSLGRAPEAEVLHLRALEMRRRLFPGDHPQVAMSLNNLASVRQALGRASEAEPLQEQALEMYRRLFTGDHPELATSLNNLASVRESLGRASEAEPLFAQALEMRRRLFPGDHRDVAMSLNNLASVRWTLGRPAEAEPLFVEALDMQGRLYPGDHPDVATTLNNVATVRVSVGRAAEAEPLLVRALEMKRRLFTPGHPDIARGLQNLAYVRVVLGRPADAEPLYEEALAIRRGSFPGDHPDVVMSLSELVYCLEVLGRGDETVPYRREALAMQRRLLPAGSPQLDAWMAPLGVALLKIGTPEAAAEAEPVLRECLEIRRTAFPDGHPEVWRRFNAMSLLGGALVGQAQDSSMPAEARLARLHEAEPLLLDGYAGLKDDPRVPPPAQSIGNDHKRMALDRIVRLYETWETIEPGTGYQDKAEVWRKKLDSGP